MPIRSTLTLSFLAVGLFLGAVGCDSKAVDSDLVGKTVTVEYKPVLTKQTESIQKQRIGVVKKASADWLVVDESGNEIWIPKEMVLEVRVEKK